MASGVTCGWAACTHDTFVCENFSPQGPPHIERPLSCKLIEPRPHALGQDTYIYIYAHTYIHCGQQVRSFLFRVVYRGGPELCRHGEKARRTRLACTHKHTQEITHTRTYICVYTHIHTFRNSNTWLKSSVGTCSGLLSLWHPFMNPTKPLSVLLGREKQRGTSTSDNMTPHKHTQRGGGSARYCLFKT